MPPLLERNAPAARAGGWAPSPLLRASAWLHAGAACALGAAPASWPWILAGLALNHAGLTFCGMMPRSALLGPNITRLPPGAGRRLALTFDDGPDPEVTPRVLDLLEAAGAGASFFLIGERAARHPALVREILRRGHSVENHTQTHPLHFAALGLATQRRQILRADAAIREAGGAPRFFRPPAGLRSPLSDPALAGTGLRLATWTWRGGDGAIGNPARVLRRLRHVGAGGIVLLHDGNCRRDAGGRPVVLSVLPVLLRRMAEAGLSSVPLPVALDAPAAPAAAAGARGSPAPGGCASR